MKIISKYKDYYDYLTGIYGVDDKIVLDRRGWEGKKVSDLTWKGKLTMCIADRAIDILLLPEGLFLLSDLFVKDEYDKILYGRKKREPDTVYINVHGDGRFRPSHYFKTVVYPTDFNTKFNIPICLVDKDYDIDGAKVVSSYPILSDYNINKHIPAQDVYLWLTEWLAPKDITNDNMTDKEKILSKGFDLKTSFRKDKN